MLFSTVAIAAFASLAAAVPVKRGFSGEATYYATGLGACGQVSVDTDFIVALNSPMFGGGYPGPNCFKQLQITANGKSAVATVMDQCPGCAYGDLDMSPSLFSHFADHSVGRFGISWDWIDGSSSPAPAPVVEEPKTSSTPEPTPSSTWVAPSSTWVAPSTSETPSSTWVAPTPASTSSVAPKIEATPASSSSAWSAPSSSSVAARSSAASSSASSVSAVATESASTSASTSATSTSSAPVPTITIDLAGGNLAQLCEAVAQMGKLVVVGASFANGTQFNTTATNVTASANVTFA